MLAVFGTKRAVAREGRDVDLVDATSRDCVLGGDNRSKRQLGMTLRQLRPKNTYFLSLCKNIWKRVWKKYLSKRARRVVGKKRKPFDGF